MKTLAITMAMVSTMIAGPAAAAGLSLTWDACATNAAATTNTDFDCADPSGIKQLFLVFNSPVAANMVELRCSLDFQIGAPSLPDYWLFRTPASPTACNDGVIGQKARPSSTICSALNPWGTSGPAVGPNMEFYPYGGGPNRGRLVIHYPRTTPFPITPDVNYYGFHVDFLSATASEAGGSCDGCTAQVAITFMSAVIKISVDGAPGPDVTITGAGIVGNCATVNGASSICDVTPARNKTWGALKSLYR